MITNAANKTRKKSFEDELWEYLEIEFGLEQTAFPELGTWLHNQVQITAKERAQLDILSHNFNKYYKNWNEDELKMQLPSADPIRQTKPLIWT